MIDIQQQKRLAAKMEGIRRAWQGIPDLHQQIACAFYIRYAKHHETFEGGDVLAAWRRTDDPIAQINWRNRWGAVSRKMMSKKYQVIERIGYVTPKNVQSHGDRAMLWKSLIYEGDQQ